MNEFIEFVKPFAEAAVVLLFMVLVTKAVKWMSE